MLSKFPDLGFWTRFGLKVRFFLKKGGFPKTGFPYVFLADPCPEFCKKGPAAQKCFFILPRPQGGTKGELALARVNCLISYLVS